jgi:SAM-dependent methyltransferase
MFRAHRARCVALLLLVGACTPATPSSSASSAAPGPSASSVPSVSIATSATSAPSAVPSASAAPAVAAVDGGDPLEVAAQREWDEGKREDIIYVPTPQKVVDKMLEVAKVKSTDVVYDLGCGDGRIVVSAAKKLGAHGIGFDLNTDRVNEARANVEHAGVGSLVTIKRANVFDVDLSPANVVMLYLLPEINVKLIPQLEKLRPGSRIVSHDFDMEGVTPDNTWTISAPEFVNEEGYSAWKGAAVPEDKKNYKERSHTIYLWTIPLHKAPPKAADAGAGDAGKKK